MLLAYLTFITGIAISAVAIYYSVLGLAAIFAAAVIPIIIMGTTLEVAKLVTAWWLKANWYRAPWSIKIYLTIAVVMLMIITSMGIFGFLSKAHTDQAIPLGDTASQVAFIDEKINNERETIANARNLIKQLDDAVMGIQSGEGREIRNRDGTTRIENPAERALQVRRSQARDRAALTQTIEEAQTRIVKLQEEKAPIAGKLRAVEAEVGPIKYIAKLIYGDNPDQNILERAVVWVIVIIVFVFDPLAVLLLLASQMSFQWARSPTKERRDELVQENTSDTVPPEESPPPPRPIEESGREDSGIGDTDPITIDNDMETEDQRIERANRELAEIERDQDIFVPPLIERPVEVDQEPVEIIEIAEPSIDQKEEPEPADDDEDGEIIKKANNDIKEAMHLWKADNPNDSLKHQRLLFEQGLIDHLPWEDYLKAQPDYEDDLAAAEAAKWAQEQLESKKKEISWIEKEGNQQVRKTRSQ